jgi:hypothetical protein
MCTLYCPYNLSNLGFSGDKTRGSKLHSTSVKEYNSDRCTLLSHATHSISATADYQGHLLGVGSFDNPWNSGVR